MLAFAASDEVSRLQHTQAEAANWRSLLPFWHFVEAKCRPFRHLHGLCLQLGAVCLEIIHVLDLDRFHRDVLPDMSAGAEAAPPTPGALTSSSESTISSNDKEQKAAGYRRDYLKWKSEMVKEARDMRQLWIDGLAELSIDDLQTHFPQTWARRSKVPAAKKREKMAPGEYDGAFYLPLSSVSTAFETVRTTTAMLAEWAKREMIDWHGRLGIS